MARDKDQLFIFSKSELALIKAVFADNDALIYTIRKVLLQFPLTLAEEELIRMSVTEPVYDVLRKRILPLMSPDFPLNQIPNILTTITNDLKVKSIDEMIPLFEAKQLEIDYLEQQFRILKDIDYVQESSISLVGLAELKDKTASRQFVDMTAYLFLLGYIDPSMTMIKVLAGQKDETPEQQEARLSKDSSK